MKTEKYNSEIVDFINKVRSTPLRKNEIKIIFTNYIKDVIKESPNEVSKLKYPCGNCMMSIFEKMETSPKIEDFMFMKFLRVEDVAKTFKDKLTNQMVTSIIGHDYEFKCEMCQARLCIYIE